ncbi:MAG: RluA family pseudouridine synthase [Gemmataceae bacterium]|nr:RluA family pseudouridine synthase [Gemmataceae bacterium]
MTSHAPILITRDEAGQTLAAVIKHRWGLTWTQARELIGAKRVRLGTQTCGEDTRRVKAGERIALVEPVAKAPPPRRQPARPRPVIEETLPDIVVRHVDDAIVVVDKPPGLTTMRHKSEAAEFGRGKKKFLPRTLSDFLPKFISDGLPFHAVHRIDKDTSGLVVFARSDEAKEFLDELFRRHDIERRYLAIVRGTPSDGRIESTIVEDRGDGRRGSGPGGQRAVTYVRVLKRLGPLSLVECRLETGRTHQVRIHLGEAGCPLAGERIYDRPPHGAPLPDPSGAKRTALHAAVLGFRHPTTGAMMRWESPMPADMAALV